MYRTRPFIIVLLGTFSLPLMAQTISFSGTIDSGTIDTFSKPPGPVSPELVSSEDLAGGVYVIELTYSGPEAPTSTDSTEAYWSGQTSATYFIYSPDNSSELLASGSISDGAGLTTVLNGEPIVPDVTPTVTVTDSVTWVLLGGELYIQFVDEANNMIASVESYPDNIGAYMSSAISLDTAIPLQGGSMQILLSASESLFNGDTDNDGVPDAQDDFPTNPDESLDTDGDRVGDNTDDFINDPLRWTDEDGDGFSEQIIPPAEFPEDGFPEDDTRWLDTDGDGVSEHDFTDDGIDNPEDAFPDDPLRWSDIDGDGFSDQDVTPDDGIDNPEDPFPENPGEWLDSDNDGYGDFYDKCDNTDLTITAVSIDGIGDAIENTYLTKGCWMSDAVEILINRLDKGVSGVAIATSYMVQAGYITGKQKGEIQSEAARKQNEREQENNGKGNGKPEDPGNDNGKGNSNGNGNGNSNDNGGGNGNSGDKGNGGGNGNANNGGGNGGGNDNANNGGGNDNANNGGGSGGGNDNANNGGGSGGGNDNANNGGGSGRDTPPSDPPVQDPPPSDPPGNSGGNGGGGNNNANNGGGNGNGNGKK